MTNPIQFFAKSKNGRQENFIIYPQPKKVIGTLQGKVEVPQLSIIKTVDGRNVDKQKDGGLIIEGEPDIIYYEKV
ncbi:hypothetical protein [Legionella sainthelensi]|uniref:Uncharacterized protein n=1 Tax=Legionella sainthelensi TaxID=28087 RepID=A0A2H5FQN4_9GAMM|nr:hypothetical protein [Legionella sainthelensi]AUH73813.1 hypothetical protein CAB17_18515 [Legionella sainthelensi]